MRSAFAPFERLDFTGELQARRQVPVLFSPPLSGLRNVVALLPRRHRSEVKLAQRRAGIPRLAELDEMRERASDMHRDPRNRHLLPLRDAGLHGTLVALEQPAQRRGHLRVSAGDVEPPLGVRLHVESRQRLRQSLAQIPLWQLDL